MPEQDAVGLEDEGEVTGNGGDHLDQVRPADRRLVSADAHLPVAPAARDGDEPARDLVRGVEAPVLLRVRDLAPRPGERAGEAAPDAVGRGDAAVEARRTEAMVLALLAPAHERRDLLGSLDRIVHDRIPPAGRPGREYTPVARGRQAARRARPSDCGSDSAGLESCTSSFRPPLLLNLYHRGPQAPLGHVSFHLIEEIVDKLRHIHELARFTRIVLRTA